MTLQATMEYLRVKFGLSFGDLKFSRRDPVIEWDSQYRKHTLYLEGSFDCEELEALLLFLKSKN